MFGSGSGKEKFSGSGIKHPGSATLVAPLFLYRIRKKKFIGLGIIIPYPHH
jgi:hypothetical protein